MRGWCVQCGWGCVWLRWGVGLRGVDVRMGCLCGMRRRGVGGLGAAGCGGGSWAAGSGVWECVCGGEEFWRAVVGLVSWWVGKRVRRVACDGEGRELRGVCVSRHAVRASFGAQPWGLCKGVGRGVWRCVWCSVDGVCVCSMGGQRVAGSWASELWGTGAGCWLLGVILRRQWSCGVTYDVERYGGKRR